MDTPGGNWISRNLHWLLIAAVLLAVSASLYKYLITQDYIFTLEAPCNPETEVCYVRECPDGECPPNELTEYRLFSLPASEYALCADNGCLNICPSEQYACKEMVCEEDDETVCSAPIEQSIEPKVVEEDTKGQEPEI